MIFVLGMVSCALVVATVLVVLGVPPDQVLVHLTLTAENNAAAWWSGMLLAMISLNAYDGYVVWRDRHHDQRAARGWLLLAPVFLFLSFCEVGSIHERIGGLGHALSVGTWPPLLVLGAVLGAACVRSLTLLWTCPNERRAVPWLIAGFCLFGLAAVQEYLEFKLALQSPWALAIRAALEEGSELLGMLIILTATLPNTTRLRREYRFAALYELHQPFLAIGVPMAVLLTAMTAMLTDYHRGQPADWIAMMGFLAAGVVLLQSRSWWDRSMGAVCCLASLAVVEATSTQALTHYVHQASGLAAYWVAVMYQGYAVGFIAERDAHGV